MRKFLMSALIAISTGSIIYSCEKPTIDQSDTPEAHINGHHVLGSWLNSSSSDDYILTCKQIRKDHRKNISSIKYIFIK